VFQDVHFVVEFSYFHKKNFHIFVGHKVKLSMLVIGPEKKKIAMNLSKAIFLLSDSVSAGL